MKNKNFKKIKKICLGFYGQWFCEEMEKEILKQFQNQRQEFVDIVEKVNSENAKSGRYFNAGSAIVCEEILKELNK